MPSSNQTNNRLAVPCIVALFLLSFLVLCVSQGPLAWGAHPVLHFAAWVLTVSAFAFAAVMLKNLNDDRARRARALDTCVSIKATLDHIERDRARALRTGCPVFTAVQGKTSAEVDRINDVIQEAMAGDSEFQSNDRLRRG